jgi:hypothetical protein
MEIRYNRNYSSGDDYVLEYGGLRFTFNETDFSERVEEAAVKLSFVDRHLTVQELEDLVTLMINGEVEEPASALGEHVRSRSRELTDKAHSSLVHWLRRLVFRSAWLDQRVIDGELDFYYDEKLHTFAYVQRGSDSPIKLSPEPSWNRLAYCSSR